jgi:hypothetical protein
MPCSNTATPNQEDKRNIQQKSKQDEDLSLGQAEDTLLFVHGMLLTL